MRAKIEVIPAARAQEQVLANLLELYAHDFSEFHGVELREDGRFGYPQLPLYWIEPGRHPFLIRATGKLAGLVLVKRGSKVSGDEAVWDMAEFFVARAYRRSGVGTEAAHQVWSRFPGPWEIRVMESNRSALPFWERAISTFVGQTTRPVRVGKSGECWCVFAFESKRP